MYWMVGICFVHTVLDLSQPHWRYASFVVRIYLRWTRVTFKWSKVYSMLEQCTRSMLIPTAQSALPATRERHRSKTTRKTLTGMSRSTSEWGYVVLQAIKSYKRYSLLSWEVGGGGRGRRLGNQLVSEYLPGSLMSGYMYIPLCNTYWIRCKN